MYKLSEEYEVMELEDEIIIQNNVSGEIHMLNGTATIIFNSIINNVSETDMIKQFKNLFVEITNEELKNDIEEVISQLIEKKIIVKVDNE